MRTAADRMLIGFFIRLSAFFFIAISKAAAEIYEDNESNILKSL